MYGILDFETRKVSMYSNAKTPETMGLILLKINVKGNGHAFNNKGRVDFVNKWIEHTEEPITIEEAIDEIADILVCGNTTIINKRTMSSIGSAEKDRMIAAITDKLEHSLLEVN